jgi:Schlafen, AlbA_2
MCFQPSPITTGGHIIVGVKDKRGTFRVEPDGQLDLEYKRDLKSWLEDIVPTLSDPGVRDLDVRTFQVATGAVAVVEIRESDDAPHQDRRTHLYYGRTGSKCKPLSHRQILDIIQRQKSPVLRILPVQIEGGLDRKIGPYQLIVCGIRNISKTVCRSYHLQIELPTTIGGHCYMFPQGRQAEFNGIQRIYTDTLSGKLAHVVEIEGGKIYPLQEKIMAFRGFDCRIDGVVAPEYLSGRDTVKVTFYADQTPVIKGETEMLPIPK